MSKKIIENKQNTKEAKMKAINLEVNTERGLQKLATKVAEVALEVAQNAKQTIALASDAKEALAGTNIALTKAGVMEQSIVFAIVGTEQTEIAVERVVKTVEELVSHSQELVEHIASSEEAAPTIKEYQTVLEDCYPANSEAIIDCHLKYAVKNGVFFDDEKSSPLKFFIHLEDVEAIKKLCDFGLDINRVAQNSENGVFHNFTVNGELELSFLQGLLECGLNPDTLVKPMYSFDGVSVKRPTMPLLNYALMHHQNDLVPILLEYGAKGNAKITINAVHGTMGYTALATAAMTNNVEGAKLLIEEGVDVNEVNFTDYNYSVDKKSYNWEESSALACAIMNDDESMVCLLVDNGANVNQRIGKCFSDNFYNNPEPHSCLYHSIVAESIFRVETNICVYLKENGATLTDYDMFMLNQNNTIPKKMTSRYYLFGKDDNTMTPCRDINSLRYEFDLSRKLDKIRIIVVQDSVSGIPVIGIKEDLFVNDADEHYIDTSNFIKETFDGIGEVLVSYEISSEKVEIVRELLKDVKIDSSTVKKVA